MKRFRYISAEQSIASYMVGFKTNRISYPEFNRWSCYLQDLLTTEDYQAIVFYGKRYIDELQREDDGFLFDIGDYSIKLAKGKSKKDLDDHVLSYVEVETLIELLNAPKGYKKKNEIESEWV